MLLAVTYVTPAGKICMHLHMLHTLTHVTNTQVERYARTYLYYTQRHMLHTGRNMFHTQVKICTHPNKSHTPTYVTYAYTFLNV